MMDGEASAYFRLLGMLLYNEPNAELLNTLSDGVFDEAIYAAENETARQGLGEISAWIKSEGKEKLLDAARADYMRLFVGVGKVLAPPWGSVYLNTDRLLFTEETLKVRQFYERYGMKAAKKYQEPDDHIGLELEFIAYLCEQGETEAALNFTAEFIVPWLSRWNADVQKYSKTGYYKGLGNMAMGGIDFFISSGTV